jgi:hypothetical protein
MPELLVSLHAALAKEDCAVALAAAAVVLGAAQPHADPMLLRMKEATQLIAQLLSCQAYLSPLDSKVRTPPPQHTNTHTYTHTHTHTHTHTQCFTHYQCIIFSSMGGKT